MRERLDEGVLDGFVGLGGVAQVVARQPPGAALMAADDIAIELAGFAGAAGQQQPADLAGQFQARDLGGAARRQR